MIKEDSNKRLESSGIFKYHDTGFEVQVDGYPRKCEWSDITKIIAYKIDRITIDDIVVEVHFADADGFRFSEETDGFYQFVKRSKGALPEILSDWEIKIVNPPFQRSEMVLFERISG